MLYRTSLVVSLIFSVCSMHAMVAPLFMGKIKFPYSVAVGMPVPIFYDGRSIKGEVHESQHQITFDVPWSRGQQSVYLLVTEKNPEKVFKPLLDAKSLHNTIDYLKISRGQSYKLYKLILVMGAQGVTWHAQAAELPDSGQIPDQTIIILYFPELVDAVEGGNSLELPSVILRDDMLSLVASEQDLAEQLVKVQLSAIDISTIHTPIKQVVQQNATRTIVVGA